MYVTEDSSSIVNYIVSEYASEGDLINLMMETDHFSTTRCRYFFRQMIEAVSFMHKAGVVHRDIKPDNIVLDQNMHIKLIDFGLAAPIEGHDGSGMLHTSCGTLKYMAPEQHLLRPYAGEKVDVFALGVTLFMMYT